MKIKGITTGLKATLDNNVNLYLTFLDIYGVIKAFKKSDIDDYCLFIKVEANGEGSTITFHDGGKGWDKVNKKSFTTVYKTLVSNHPIESIETLYYDIDEEVICFLHER